jgi:nucleotide-binding universal stress UspA family protein
MRRARAGTVRILLTTDGSAMSRLAADLLADWAPESARIRVISVSPTGADLFAGPWANIAIAERDAVDAAAQRNARAFVEDAARRVEGGQRKTDTEVLSGRPSDTIAAEAVRWGADIVVAGARGHGTLEQILVGSVTTELLDRLRVPLLIARDAGLEKVLVATDASETSAEAMAFVATSPLFARSRFRFRVVSVEPTLMPWWTGMTPMDTAAAPSLAENLEAGVQVAQQATDAGVRRLRDAGREADGEVRQGQPAAGIVDAARAWGANLIVVGSHGRTGLAGLLLGGTARSIASSAPCSVLVVRRRDGSEPGAANA